jgi:hypothetical protein
MTDIKDVASEAASEAILISNTPRFLLDKLKSDVFISMSSKSYDGDTIFKAFSDAIKMPPNSVTDRARPYIYIAMLSVKADGVKLSEAEKLDTSSWRWMKELISMAKPTASTIISTSAPLHPKVNLITSAAGNSPPSVSSIIIGVNR